MAPACYYPSRTVLGLNADQEMLVVKHTFLQVEAAIPLHHQLRRARSDTVLLECGTEQLPGTCNLGFERPSLFGGFSLSSTSKGDTSRHGPSQCGTLRQYDADEESTSLESGSQDGASQDTFSQSQEGASQDGSRDGGSSENGVPGFAEGSSCSWHYAPSSQERLYIEKTGHTAMGRGKKQSKQNHRTTVMLRNVPGSYARDMLAADLDENGFAGMYDFIHVPMDIHRDAGLGYAFINLVHPDVASRLWTVFDGFTGWSVPSKKVCEVSWSSTLQGLRANIGKHRNSSMMHASVPDRFKPAIFKRGVRVPFPAPTKNIRGPFRAGHGGAQVQEP